MSARRCNVALSVVLFGAALEQALAETRVWRESRGHAIDRYFVSHCGISIVDAANFSTSVFEERLLAHEPVLIRNLTAWQAAQKHWDRAAFKEAFGDLEGTKTVPLFSAQFGVNANPQKEQKVKLKSYLGELHASNKRTGNYPLLFFDRSHGELGQRVLALHGTPASLKAMNESGEALPVVSLGAHGQGITMHQHAQTWLSLVRGRKIWFLRAPNAAYGSVKAYEVMTLKSPKKWPASLIAQLGEHSGLHVCEQLPGDVMYVPALWYHATENDGDVLGVGMQLIDLFPQNTGGMSVANSRFPGSALLKDHLARDKIIALEAQKPTPSDWEQPGKAALAEINASIAMEPLDFGRRANAVRAQARVARLNGTVDNNEVLLTLFKGWKEIERLANHTRDRGVLSRQQFAAVMGSLILNIRTAVPDELAEISRGVIKFLAEHGMHEHAETFRSFGIPEGDISSLSV
jgi:hypothetical protein